MTAKKVDRQQNIAIKVRVTPKKPVTPVASHRVEAEPPALAPRKTARPTLHELPLEHRKRIMWWTVGIGMFVIMLGWAFALGHEFGQPDRETSLIGRITNVFRTFKLPTRNTNSTPGETEIRQLEGEVFPQFQQ